MEKALVRRNYIFLLCCIYRIVLDGIYRSVRLPGYRGYEWHINYGKYFLSYFIIYFMIILCQWEPKKYLI